MSDLSTRQFRVEFTIAMLAYVLALLVSIWLLQWVQVSGYWRWLVALMPVPPIMMVGVAVLRDLRRIDEMQRKVQFEALAFAFGGTALLTFSYGFLENVGFPKLPTFAIWPIMAVLWIIGLRVMRRRYL